MLKHPAIPYVFPMAVFLTVLTIQNRLASMGALEFPLRVVFLALVLWVVSRHVISFRCVAPVQSILLGIAVCAMWVLPDQLFPAYRTHWLFQNDLTGNLKTSIDPNLLASPMVLIFRSIRAVILVPIIEELFWRAWLMRWMIKPDFESVPLGTYSTQAFWIVAVLFASEHGPYWDVGLACGVIYNWWMVRTKSLGDLILTHGVTNLCLSLFTIYTKQWQYWQ
jgi:CAAX prenyl protease-like protein